MVHHDLQIDRTWVVLVINPTECDLDYQNHQHDCNYTRNEDYEHILSMGRASPALKAPIARHSMLTLWAKHSIIALSTLALRVIVLQSGSQTSGRVEAIVEFQTKGVCSPKRRQRGNLSAPKALCLERVLQTMVRMKRLLERISTRLTVGALAINVKSIPRLTQVGANQ